MKQMITARRISHIRIVVWIVEILDVAFGQLITGLVFCHVYLVSRACARFLIPRYVVCTGCDAQSSLGVMYEIVLNEEHAGIGDGIGICAYAVRSCSMLCI